MEDALSQQYEDEGPLLDLSAPIPDLLNQSLQEWLQDPSIAQLLHKIQMDPNLPHGYSWTQRTLKYKGLLMLIPTSSTNTQIMQELHSSTIEGHLVFQKTYACAQCSSFGQA